MAACGNLTGGGLGEATVAVTGNVPPPILPPLSSLVAAEAPFAPTSHDLDDDEADEAEGSVRVRFLVSLVSERGSETRLGDDEIEVEVDLQGLEELDVVTEFIPAIRYTELRIVFTEIKAEVEGGLVINGQPVIGELHVELEDLALLVTRPIDLDVGHGDAVSLLVDLNAPAWLTAVDPVTLSIDQNVFADLVNVVIP
jgi:hypothetical protein